jgi:riboflavin synthase
MFTGIIEAQARVLSIIAEEANKTFTLQTPLASEFKVDQSIAHNGVCLTVESINLAEKTYTVTAIHETLTRTNLGAIVEGDELNLERCLRADARLDGHFVQGHVDTTGQIESIEDEGGSWRISIRFDEANTPLVVEKGSICIDGISLTVAACSSGLLQVAIIPYTWDHTNLHRRKVGDSVNLEFDILGKYIVGYLRTSRG